MDNKRVFLVFLVLILLVINLQAETTTELGIARKNVEKNSNAYSVSETTMDEQPGEPEKQASEVVRMSRGLSSYTNKDTKLSHPKRFSIGSVFHKSKAKNSMHSKHHAENGKKFSLSAVLRKGLKGKESSNSKHRVENQKKFSLGDLLHTETKPSTHQYTNFNTRKGHVINPHMRLFTLGIIFQARPKPVAQPRPPIDPRLAIDLGSLFKSGPRATSLITAKKNLGEPTTSGLEREHYVAYDKVSDEASKAMITTSNVAGEDKNAVQNEASQVTSNASDMASKTKESVQNGTSKVENQASNVVGEAKDGAQNEANDAKNGVQNVTSQVADTGSNVANQASNMAGEAKDGMQNGASQVASQASNAASDAKNGTQNGASQVADKASNITTDATNGIKNETDALTYTAAVDKIEELKESSKRRAESAIEASRMGATEFGTNASNMASGAEESVENGATTAKDKTTDIYDEAKEQARKTMV